MGPFHERFPHRNSNSMGNWFQCNCIVGYHIATKFCTCHDSTTVVPYAKFDSDHFSTSWTSAERIFHRIWISMEKSFVKCFHWEWFFRRQWRVNKWLRFAASEYHLIVRRAGLLWSQQDFEWRWSVPLFKSLTVLEFSFILFDLCLLITFFNFIMNYVPIVTFWIFTYHKIWILSIMFCFIWSYWIIYFLACLEVSWRVVS